MLMVWYGVHDSRNSEYLGVSTESTFSYRFLENQEDIEISRFSSFLTVLTNWP